MTNTQYQYKIPLTPNKTTIQRMAHFPENVYRVEEGSHLYNFVDALCGDAGAGDLKKKLLLTRLQQTLANTNFLDLDKIYGDPLRLTRFSSEIYPYNPFSDYLTSDQWDEIKTKDAMYRMRIAKYMKGIAQGTTANGISLCAESAIGEPVTVVDNYKFIDAGVGGIVGRLDVQSREEITLIPNSFSITQSDQKNILSAVDKIRPMDRIFTVSLQGIPQHFESQLNTNSACASSEYIEIQKQVIGRQDWPDQGKNWVQAGEVQDARYRAFMDHQEWSTDMFNQIKNVAASSETIGQFNKFQTRLFSHIPQNISSTYAWGADQALYGYSKNVNTPVLWITDRQPGF